VPPKRLKGGEVYVVGVAVVGTKDELLVWAGQRYLRMGEKEIDHFGGDRALRSPRAAPASPAAARALVAH
jgi:hypothetical protein